MENNVLEEAIANIASSSKSLEAWCNEPKNYNSGLAITLEQISWDMLKMSNDLREIQYLLGV